MWKHAPKCEWPANKKNLKEMEKHLYISLPKLKSSEIQDIHFKINLLLFSVDDQTEKVDDKKVSDIG